MDPAFACVVLLGFPAAFLIASLVIQGGKRRRAIVRAFASGVRRQRGFGVQVFRDCTDVTLPSGRVVHAVLSERREVDGERSTKLVPCAALSIEVTDAPPVRITRESVATFLEKLVGLTREAEIGVPAFDDKFVIKTEPGGPAAETLSRSTRARLEIERLFDRDGVTVLESAGGRVRIEPPLRVTDIRDVGTVLVALDAIAAELSRVRLRVNVLGVERSALAIGGGPRCAYCHAGVTGHEPDLVACAACATILHEGCWAELGRCPVLGCGGTRPERGTRALG